MNITNIQPISAQQLGTDWRFSVSYTATFTPEEVNQPLNYTFRDSIQIWEWDITDHDPITAWKANSNFNPSATSVQRTKVVTVAGDDLDTELGGEEIRAKIQLRNFTTGGVPQYKYSSVIHLSP